MTLNRHQYGPVTVFFGEKNGKYPDGNQVLVKGGEAQAIFDTPLCTNRLVGPGEGALANSPLAGTDLVILGHVHEDHTAGLHLVPNVPVYAPEQDVAAVQSMEGMLRHYGYSPDTSVRMSEKIVREFHFQPRPDAQGYANGHTWDLGGGVSVRAIHMPGHTRGHSVLWVEPGAIAFIGDIDLSGFGPYYADACSNLREFRETLRRMEHLDARVWITFHHKGVITERETYLELLRAFADKIERREQAIFEALGPDGRSLDELVAHRFMYPQGFEDVFIDDAERICLQEHLAALMEDGRVTETDGIYRQSG